MENKPTIPFHIILFSILIVVILGSLLGKIVFGDSFDEEAYDKTFKLLEVKTEKQKIVEDVKHIELKWPKYTIRNWLDGARKPIPKLSKLTPEMRAKELLDMNWIGYTLDAWKTLWAKYKVDYIFAISVAWSETHLGRATLTKGNISNIWNNDRGDKVHMDSFEQGIESFYKAMNNKYLGNYDQIKYLSGEWRTRAKLNGCVGRWDYCFATSKHHWETNVVNMMSALYDKQIDWEYYFRK